MSLQDRLDQAFGALQHDAEQPPAWKPSSQQIFRSGLPIPDAAGASSDEEYEELQRRTVVPGACPSDLQDSCAAR